MRYEYKTENTCGRRPTSCTDQLAKAVRTAYNEINQSV
ncbi:MAG: TSCPD domain-containing protein [Agathobacter sp.]|nr:TSCPD domain-containing protein [Agathobacter sp.]